MYNKIEDALRLRIVEHISELSLARCQAGEFDKVFTAMLEENEQVGCVLDFYGGNLDNSPPFNKPVWLWRILCIVMVRYNDTIERDLRNIIAKFSTMLKGYHTLEGVTPLVRIRAMEAPEPAEGADIPMYWFPIVFEAYDIDPQS